MEEHVLPKEGSDPVDAAALHWSEKHPEDDIDHPVPVAPREPAGVVPNHHSASAEAAALHWREKHPDDEGEWEEPE